MEYSQHLSYFFVPVSFSEPDAFSRLKEKAAKSPNWIRRDNQTRYMLRYIADKMDNRSENPGCLCGQYALTSPGRIACGLPDSGEVCETVLPYSFRPDQKTAPFRMEEVRMFLFSTGVCILAYAVLLNEPAAEAVIDALFPMKRAAARLRRVGADDDFSLLDVSKKLMAEFGKGIPFAHTDELQARMNVMTYLEVPPQGSYDRELFYLRHCYSRNYRYIPRPEQTKKYTVQLSGGTIWGTSSEALVCLCCPGQGDEAFLRGPFFHNFTEQYLFMYVFLLHQKYVLYKLLTELGVGKYNTLETLEDYRHRLYEFKTDFVFSYITEVPQYQVLYDRLVEAFELDALYRDVQEPLASLAEIRREAEEDKQQRHDKRVNRALTLLSILSVVSFFTDGMTLVELMMTKMRDGSAVSTVQWICLGVSLLALAAVIVRLVMPAREKRKKSGGKRHDSDKRRKTT